MKYIFLLFLTLYISSDALAEHTFSVGVTAPMSGDLAAVGQEIQRGLELASKDKSNDIVKYKIIIEDDQYLGRQAAGNAKKLISHDNVGAIISLWDMAEIVAPIAEEKKIPHFAIRWNPHVAEKYEHTMTIESTYLSYMKSLVELLKVENMQTVSIIYEEAEGWLLGLKRFKELLMPTKIKIVAETSYVRGGTDQTSIVKKVLVKNPDIVLLFTNPPFLEMLIKKIKELNTKQKFTGYFELLDHPEMAESMPFVAQLEPEEWFVKKYYDAYRMPIKSRATQSYDILSLINDAVTSVGLLQADGDSIVKHISNIKNYPGASGILNAGGTRTIEMNCVWKIARDGKFILYKNLTHSRFIKLFSLWLNVVSAHSNQKSDYI